MIQQLVEYFSKGWLFHLTTITGQSVYLTTSEAVIPTSIRLIPEIPLVPNTIKLALFFSAYSTITFGTGLHPSELQFVHLTF